MSNQAESGGVVAIGVDRSVESLTEELTQAEAAELTARIGRALEHAELLIAKAYLGSVWVPLGLPSWNAYVEKFFQGRPILVVPRQDRPVVVRSLADTGMSGRSIAAAIGVSEGTVRNDLRDDEGAQNYAPVIDISGTVTCPTCGEEHPTSAGTCPYLEGAFGPITDQQDQSQELFGPGRRQPGARDAENLPDDDDDDDWIDTPADGGLVDVDESSAEAAPMVSRRRVERVRTAVERVGVLRDDLEELPAVIETLAIDSRDWPAETAAARVELATRLQGQVDAIRALLPHLPDWLTAADAALATLAERR